MRGSAGNARIITILIPIRIVEGASYLELEQVTYVMFYYQLLIFENLK